MEKTRPITSAVSLNFPALSEKSRYVGAFLEDVAKKCKLSVCIEFFNLSRSRRHVALLHVRVKALPDDVDLLVNKRMQLGDLGVLYNFQMWTDERGLFADYRLLI